MLQLLVTDDGVVTLQSTDELYVMLSAGVSMVSTSTDGVELTKMAPWLEGYEPGKPVSFLDRHLLCGNSCWVCLIFLSWIRAFPKMLSSN